MNKDLATIFYESFKPLQQNTLVTNITSDAWEPGLYKLLSISVEHKKTRDTAEFTRTNNNLEAWQTNFIGVDIDWFKDCFDAINSAWDDYMKGDK